MKTLVVVLAAGMCRAITLAAEGMSVEWPKSADVPEADRRRIERKALESIAYLGKNVSEYRAVAARIEPRISRRGNRDFVELMFWKGPESGSLRIQCAYPDEEGVRLVHDTPLERRAAPFTSGPTVTTRERALDRAKAVARQIGKIDLDDRTQWEFFLWGFVNSNWQFNWRPLVSGYPAPGLVFVEIADDENYGVVTFHNAVYVRPDIKPDVRIARRDARELADKYLNRYYHKHEVKTLEFTTNVLEIVVPNYAFAVRDTGDDETSATNAPVLVWKAIYSRSSNTLERTPVQIWVDATDGSMRGGWE